MAEKMLFRFGVILTPESSDVEVLVLGSREEMGHWEPNRAVRMKVSHNLPSPDQPCLWTCEVELAEPFKDTFWFKFIKRIKDSFIWEGTQWVISIQTDMTLKRTNKNVG